MGRPSIITERHVEGIKEALEVGMTIDLACAYIGIPKSTFYNWKKRAEAEPSSIFGRFMDAASRGRAMNAFQSLQEVRKAGGEDWRAAAWMLERRHGYHRKLEQEVSVGAIAEEQDPGELLERIMAALPIAEALGTTPIHEDEEE